MSKITDWSVKWEMPFNIHKSQILHVGSRNVKNGYEMRIVIIKNIHSVKGLGATVTSNLKFPSSATSPKQTKFSFKNKDVVLLLFGTFVRPRLEYAVQFWSSHYAKDIVKLGVQRRWVGGGGVGSVMDYHSPRPEDHPSTRTLEEPVQ